MQSVVNIVDDDLTSLWTLQESLKGIGADIRGFTSAAQFLADYNPCACECLITDLRMPEMSGLEVQRRLIERGATIPIIFVTAYSEIREAVTAVKRGAVDFLEKPVNGADLREKVQAALAMSRELHVQRMDRSVHEARIALLSEREREIVELVVLGKSSREIGELLAISPRTVENHRAKAMEKLRVASAVELARVLG